ncbi:hypothetical protein SIN8267_02515 [Sinobacterium norvegicum]|uniref:Nucleotide-binding protein SIN8267_02515 n=1 Tax=Sinobacterium norvegicum TaxID=1641715 RepID=A0ABM9AGW5_9GAMM|nr:YajQ family cyclic di-GMP-binding protein [Sinobacterium norvegicum]CAH0992395.1 hypothetical protein SIN8267_02515 [Sinobacterium norvegicum]
MPSFDTISEVDKHQLTNAVDQARRVITTRFDFKGVDAQFDLDGMVVGVSAGAEFQVSQMVDILTGTLHKCNIDPGAMDLADMVTTGMTVRQSITFKNGLDKDACRKIMKAIKETKFKVKATIQDEQVRVEGKKRDDLQQIMNLLRGEDYGQPLQFKNFRD